MPIQCIVTQRVLFARGRDAAMPLSSGGAAALAERLCDERGRGGSPSPLGRSAPPPPKAAARCKAAAMAAEKKSLAFLADKFNTEAPAGSCGQRRVASPASKPPAEPPKRGKPPPGGAAAAADDDDDDDERRRAHARRRRRVCGEEAAAAAEEGLDGEAGDTRELDLAETQRYEKAGASMDQTEAGYAIEPFNMRAERSEGHFDESFNYVWNRKDDDLHDAWLKETDGATAESDEKVQKRREILRRQRATQDEPAAPAADLPTLRRALALLQPGESTARALKRLAAPTAARAARSRASKSARARTRERRRRRRGCGAGAGADPAAEAAEARRKADFAALTDAADAAARWIVCGLLGDARGDRRAAGRRGRRRRRGGGGAGGGGVRARPGVGIYYSSASGLYHDPNTSLYWQPGAEGSYYYWDAAAQTFKPYEWPAAAAPAEEGA